MALAVNYSKRHEMEARKAAGLSVDVLEEGVNLNRTPILGKEGFFQVDWVFADSIGRKPIRFCDDHLQLEMEKELDLEVEKFLSDSPLLLAFAGNY